MHGDIQQHIMEEISQQQFLDRVKVDFVNGEKTGHVMLEEEYRIHLMILRGECPLPLLNGDKARLSYLKFKVNT